MSMLRKWQFNRYLKRHKLSSRYILSCVVEGHLLSMDQGASILNMEGKAILPYMQQDEVTTSVYKHIIDNHIPLIIYNTLVVQDFPDITELKTCLTAMEKAISKNSFNPWVGMLYKAFMKKRTVTKEVLLSLGESEIAKLEIARGPFQNDCAKHISSFQGMCLKPKIKKQIINWLRVKKNEVYECE